MLWIVFQLLLTVKFVRKSEAGVRDNVKINLKIAKIDNI